MTSLGASFGSWKVAALDPVGKRATVQCVCGVARQVAVAALLDGSCTGCGCRATPRSSPATRKSSPFASELVALERESARFRHRGGGL
jgi:hypothetical protein